jgi:large subunit ribosomal protein L25
MIVREVQPEDFIRVEVELALKSLPDAVRSKNATAVRLQKRVKVRSRVRDLPKKIMVDLSDLSVSETLTAGDIDLPKGVELVTPSDAKLFTLREAKG